MNEERSVHLAVRRYVRLYGMSERQATAYTLSTRGYTISSIALRMGIRDGTVMTHLYNARRKRSGLL